MVVLSVRGRALFSNFIRSSEFFSNFFCSSEFRLSREKKKKGGGRTHRTPYQVVVEETHTCHKGSHRNALGLSDMLLHVVPLQLSSVTEEDGELVEFNAVQKGFPCLLAGSRVK